MKNKRLIGLSLTLFGLVLMYAGTYAYYMRVVNGTITGKTGAFTFDVLHNNETFTSIDLYDTITGTPSIESSDKVIIPGDKGSFVLTATGVGSSSDIEYTIMFNGSSTPSNMKFYLDEAKTKVLDVETNKIYGYLDKNGSMVKEHTIYWEWPYDSGRYNDLDYEYANKNISINVKVEGKQSKDGMLVYGVKRNTSATSTAWERVGDSIGLEANAVLPASSTTVADTGVVNDFDNIYPWSEIKSYNYNANTRKVTAWYGDANFKFDGSNGEVLTYIPGFYYKREVVDGVEYQYISKYEQEGYSYSEPFSVGRYKMSGGEDAHHTSTGGGSNTSNKNSNGYIELMMTDQGSSGGTIGNVFTGKSISGAYPSAYENLPTFRESASKLGTDFSILDYHYYVLQMLYLVEYADYDSQSVLGKGVTGNDGAIIMGGTDSLGMKSGCLVNDGKHSMIYRGIEDIYGNTLDFLDGINIKNGHAYINYDFTTYKSDVFDGNYKALGYVNKSFGDNGGFGYITKLGYDSNNPLIGLPTEVDINNTDINNPLGIKDVYGAHPGDLILVVGGSFYYSIVAGLWLSLANDGSVNDDSYVGSRLIRHQTSGGREVANLQNYSPDGK